MAFLNIGFIDILDIVLVAYLFFKLYQLLKGTVAINIFVGILTFWAVWWIVKALDMQLLSTILGQFIGVGVIALIIVFQQELRRFFLLIGSEYLSNINLSLENVFSRILKDVEEVKVYSIAVSCISMAKKKTGALIVISDDSRLENYSESGTLIDSETSGILLESIFFKNSPLHDGAVIIVKDKIHAAACILPVSKSKNLPSKYGLRHRSALGITEVTNALAITVSEETGRISYFKNGKIFPDINGADLRKMLESEFLKKYKNTVSPFKKLKILDLNPFKN
ncbi:MAG: TIGR00159 family protein [Bacteroidetes bacterium]|nr:MAG: TIGR00159 family protein [Bacteroidota bacterium]